MLTEERSQAMKKAEVFQSFKEYISPYKVEFFENYNLDFVMGKREGPVIEDLDGEKALINLHCNGGVFNLGHRNPEIIQTLREALSELDIGNHHLISWPRAKLAAQLAELAPGDLQYTVFGVSGGEAVDLALKVAMGYTGRNKVISAKGGYHGHTGLALAAGEEKYKKPFNISLPNFVQVPFDDIEAIERTVDSDTAAVILETIPATLGMPIPSPEYLPRVKELCRKNGALLILDEVQAGLGRTGKFWAFEHFQVVPDIAVLGKGLSGGIYPITATILDKRLIRVFEEDPFVHISTFGGSELGCVVASKVLELSSRPEFLENVEKLGVLFEKGVESLREKYPQFVRGLRRKGLMMGLELSDPMAGPLLTKTAFDSGLLLVYASHDPSVCQLLPPLNIEEKLIPEIFDRLEAAVKMALSFY